MNARVFTGATRLDAIPPGDRGLAYGDGVFETMRAHRGDIPWWHAHWSRLQAGARRLGMDLPAESRVLAEARGLLDGGDAVLKLVVTRGGGGRGYAPGNGVAPTWIVSTHPLPAAPAEGLALRWCETRLAVQPRLAGIKHCNRLEQVLARAEWNQPGARGVDAAEGLMRSTEGDVVGATAANVFVLHGDRWVTPAIDRCGVAGVCRAWVLRDIRADETRLDVTGIETADAIFLCNAVRGILPVATLGGREWAPHPQVAAIRMRLAAAHPGFAC